MEGYTYPSFVQPPPFMQMMTPEGAYPDHGDGFGDYYPMSPMCRHQNFGPRQLKPTTKKHRDYRPRSRSPSRTPKSRSRSRTPPRSRDKSRSRSRSRSRSPSRSPSVTKKEPRRSSKIIREPSFLDAFRVLYLTPSQTKKNTTKFLATKKSQDRVQELLKRDGLGSKKWFFYPRAKEQNSIEKDLKEELKNVYVPRESCDQRVKLDADFFRKYKKNTKVAVDAPIAKLKRWELILYKKLGFIQAV